MSKERLEVKHIIETVKRETVIAKGTNSSRDNVNLPIDLVLVLIKQAERVQELEEFKFKVEKIYKYTHINAKKSVAEKEKLEKENNRYREALEFYADRDNYKLEHFDPNLDDYMSTVDYDEGQKARQTIGSEKIND